MSFASHTPRRLTVALLLALTLGGCMTLPETRHPNDELPAAWRAGTPVQAAGIDAEWWKRYDDPVLDALIAEAREHNRDLALAAARIEEARANLGLARADLYPEAQIALNAKRTKATDRGSMPGPSNLINNTYAPQLQASYEVDLWGRYRSAAAAARADLLASEYAREVVRLSLTAEVARNYFTLRALDAQVALANDTLANRRSAVELQRKRLDVGMISELELRQAEAELASTQASLAGLQGQLRRQETALGVLLGRAPRQLVEQGIARGKSLAELPAPPDVPLGLPSDLLQRRPDLRQSEARLAAAHARIEQARAALFPEISLTAYLGSESRALSDLFSGPATVWGIAASLVQTVFNAGRTEAGIRGADARQEQTLVEYEQSVQAAFRDVLDALASHRQARELAEAETRRAEALRHAVSLADLQYRNGLASHLTLLDAQRNQYQAEQGRIDAQAARLSATADLYLALGGGWEDPKAASVSAVETPAAKTP